MEHGGFSGIAFSVSHRFHKGKRRRLGSLASKTGIGALLFGKFLLFWMAELRLGSIFLANRRQHT
jgi:hypothetical protein